MGPRKVGSSPNCMQVVSEVVWKRPSLERESWWKICKKMAGLGEFRYVVGGGGLCVCLCVLFIK